MSKKKKKTIWIGEAESYSLKKLSVLTFNDDVFGSGLEKFTK